MTLLTPLYEETVNIDDVIVEDNFLEESPHESLMENEVAADDIQYDISEEDEHNFMEQFELMQNGVAPQFITIDGVMLRANGLADPRNGDGWVVEYDEDTNEARLELFDGSYHDLWQVAGGVWQTESGVDAQMTVGITKTHVRPWAANAYSKGKSFVEKPTMRSTACRSVIMAIQRKLKMKAEKAFPFKTYVRTKVLAEKVKGLIRHVTDCIHKAEAVDDLGALMSLYKYFDMKLLYCIELMPVFNQQATIKYLESRGYKFNVV